MNDVEDTRRDVRRTPTTHREIPEASTRPREIVEASAVLRKDLLEVKKRKPNVRPRYRDVEEYRHVAAQVVDCYEPGRTRGEIGDAVATLETHDTFKLVRALSELIGRDAEFETRSPAPPERLREAVFERGFVTTEAERRDVLARVGEAFGISAATVEADLWADRDDEAVLVEAPDVDPGALLRRYNRSLTQTLLFDAVELSFAVSDNYQAIFSRLSYLGLMYEVEEDLTVHVTGPASLFSGTRKYGTAMAKLLPTIVAADEWEVWADVETEVGGEPRIYEFHVDASERDLFPEPTSPTSDETYDSGVERDFATRIGSLLSGWTVTREPTILRTGRRVMIPDFGFERERDGAEFYLEVVGFWTPEYVEEKLAKVRQVEADHPIVLAVNQELNCTQRDFDEANVDQVFFYRDRIPVKPVLDRINELDRRAVEADLERLRTKGIDVPEDEVVEVEALAASNEVAPAAVREHLSSEYPGAISNGRYVPPSVLETLRREVEATAATTLADVNGVLEAHGLGQEILERIGYEVRYVSLDQSAAEIRPKDS